MSSGNSTCGADADKYGSSNRHSETVAPVKRGDIVLWQGALRTHVVEVIPGEKVAGPTMRDTPLVRAGTVLKQLSADEIIGQDGKGLVHVLDGQTAMVYDGDEIVATQSLHGHSTELWLEYVAGEHGWDNLAPRYREVLR